LPTVEHRVLVVGDDRSRSMLVAAVDAAAGLRRGLGNEGAELRAALVPFDPDVVRLGVQSGPAIAS
jgi:hypothetical protein